MPPRGEIRKGACKISAPPLPKNGGGVEIKGTTARKGVEIYFLGDFTKMNNTNEHSEKIGEIKEGFFLRVHIGDGETETGIKFELAQSAVNSAPIVIIGKKAFFLSWDDIVKLAEKAGLFDEVQK